MRDLRISVRSIQAFLSSGTSPERILEAYSLFETADLDAVQEFHSSDYDMNEPARQDTSRRN